MLIKIAELCSCDIGTNIDDDNMNKFATASCLWPSIRLHIHLYIHASYTRNIPVQSGKNIYDANRLRINILCLYNGDIFFMLEDMGSRGERIVIKTMYSSKCFLNSWFMIVHTDSCIFVCLQMYSFSASEFMWSFLIKNREVSPDDQTGERVCIRLIHGLKFNLWPYGTFPVLETASFVFP